MEIKVEGKEVTQGLVKRPFKRFGSAEAAKQRGHNAYCHRVS
ncbi:MAG: hypothetical protein AAGE99_03155 [Chlamydiota bacterium]